MADELKKKIPILMLLVLINITSSCRQQKTAADPVSVLDANRHILFHPGRYYTSPPEHSEDLYVAAGDGVKIHCRVYHSLKPRSPAVLLFHGNGETVSGYDHIAGSFRSIGVTLFVAGYRQYGRSEGTVKAEHLKPDAAVISDYFINYFNAKNPSGPLFLMGRSLGGISAAAVAASESHAYKGLILESTFSDAVPVLEYLGAELGDDPEVRSAIRQFLYIPGYLEKTRFPVLILHGTKDTLIPFFHAEENIKHITLKDHSALVRLEGAAHNNTFFHPDYFNSVKNFISGVSP